MTNLFKSKIIFIIITALCLSLILTGCVEKNINVSELLPQSIETMKTLDSYESNVNVSFASESESDKSSVVNMNAFISYHKEPFAYSNVQKITSSTHNTDSVFDEIMLSILVKDDVVYTSNSVTGLWQDESDPALVEDIKSNAETFQNFNTNQLTDLELISLDKNKATIKARTTNSEFLKSLLNSFDTNITGNVEMIIDIKTKYMESFIYYPEINGNYDENNKIAIFTKSFNNAPEVVIPEEALY